MLPKANFPNTPLPPVSSAGQRPERRARVRSPPWRAPSLQRQRESPIKWDRVAPLRVRAPHPAVSRSAALAIRGRRRASSVRFRRHPSTPTPSLTSTQAPTPARCSGHTASSPDSKPQRLAPPYAAVRARRLLPRPVRARESSPEDPQAVPHPRPAGHCRRFAGIWPDRRRPVPGDPIASSQFFTGTHLRSKGILVTL
jgi:hypothetical protein